jgi:hypothetical protein
MSYFIRHRFGGNDRDPPLEALDALLGELDDRPVDPEHPSVALVHESHWALAVYPRGLITLENVEDLAVEPQHLVVQDRGEARSLLQSLAEGDLDEVFAAAWRPGYGP